MSTESILCVIAILRAYSTRDAEGIEKLINDAPASIFGDVIDFALMIIGQNTDERAVDYLDHMARQAYAIRVAEVARTN